MDSGKSAGLIKTSGSSVILGADSTNVTPNGRPSLRLQSVKSYDTGLVIADLAHMPGSICGAWPALWLLGPDWPSNGEIDIIEGVNSQTENSMTLHTAPGCSISNTGAFGGTVKTTNCDINAPGQGQNAGCGIQATDSNSYGDGFNSVGGGVYATEWNADAISIWHFQRNAIPADIISGNPNPAGWGKASAQFKGSCDITKSFKQQSLIIDTTFCGQWAGQQAVWEADPVCSKKAATCQDYVANNPADFAEAFWQFNSLKVYSLPDGLIGANPLPASSGSPPPPAAAPTSAQPPAVVPAPAPTPTAAPAPAAPPPPGPAPGASSHTRHRHHTPSAAMEALVRISSFISVRGRRANFVQTPTQPARKLRSRHFRHHLAHESNS